MKRTIHYTAAALLGLVANGANAASGDFDFSLLNGTAAATQAEAQALVQDIFDLAVADLGSALSYKPVAPAEPLGIVGVDLGLIFTGTQMANAKDWDQIVDGGNAVSTLPTIKLMAQKGLPFDIDVGAFYLGASHSNIKLYGGELRYALLSGGIASPALAVRASFSQLSGIKDFTFSTQGLDLSVSKGILMFTPYAGAGMVQYSGKYSQPLSMTIAGTPFSMNLKEASDQVSKVFVGVNLNLGLLNFCLDGDKTGDSTSYSLKMGFRF